jgi:hypothetical protein
MDGYSGIQFGGQGHFGNINISGKANPNSGQSVDVTQLQVGDTFKGEIASVNGEEVQILLTNGQYMNARLERDVQVALGQILNLQVQSNKDNKIVLKPFYDNNAQLIRVGEAALRAANIAVNDKNLNLVSNLLQNGMSIDKNTLMTFNRLAIQNPQADISKIIELNKLEVPVNEENLNQLKSYENMQYKLIDGVEQTADEILNLYESISQENNGQGEGVVIAAKFMEQVVEMLSDDEAIATNEGNTDISQKSDIPVETVSNDNVNNNVANNTINNESNNSVVNTLENKNVPHETIYVINNTNKVEQGISIHNNETSKVEGELSNILKELSNSNPSEIPEKIIKYITDGKLDMKNVKQLLSDGNMGERLSTEQEAEIFKSEPFKSLVKNTLQNRWTLTPDDISQEGKVEEFYEKLSRETMKLSKMINETINESGQDPSTIQAKAASSMNENIEFMNQVNHMMNYVQLPLRLSNSQAHGDLYVYTNKKHMAGNDGTLTAFLHLDMDNLGAVDVSIALHTDKNQVTTKFYLDEDVISLVEEHKDELVNRLASKGYKCNAVLLEKDDEKTVLEHLEEQVSGQSAMIGYQTFDIRA